jgi:uncharacterized protein DUF1116
MTLLGGTPHVVNAGVGVFADELERQGVAVTRLEWQPSTEEAIDSLNGLALHAAAIAHANDEALERLQSAHPVLVGLGTAGELLPGMERNTILHAGPPLSWDEMSGPLRGAVVGAALYEGLARTAEQAEHAAASGAFDFGPCHDRGAVGPMAGVVSASMPMWIVENADRGNRGYCTLNEGLGRVLRYGANDPEVIGHLRWLEQVLAPVLADALARLSEPLDLRSLIANALQMGDDGHNRNRAGTSLLLRELLPILFESDRPAAELRAAAGFIAGNDHFFLNLTMPAAKVAADAASGIAGSTLVTTMARNATSFGLRVSGLGERWFTAPAPFVDGLYLPSFGPQDAARDMGDSAITETVGIGAFAMAGAPAIVRYVGGSAADAISITCSMYDITWGESRSYQIAALDFRGTPLGVDCREVVHLGMLPVINTGIAHREAGVGQIGAGIVRPPLEPFVEALYALADKLR